MIFRSSRSELLARLRRRATQITEPTTRKVFRGERGSKFRPRKFACLEDLLRNAGEVCSKTTIVKQVWDHNFDPEPCRIQKPRSARVALVQLRRENSSLRGTRGI